VFFFLIFVVFCEPLQTNKRNSCAISQAALVNEEQMNRQDGRARPH